ncbi:MAG: hypothetical protein GOV01_00125 [Candidatus Altiarchaeota archaeon]|nr:hypothetical protein [Candidatus Altiarchaeota archaeon]
MDSKSTCGKWIFKEGNEMAGELEWTHHLQTGELSINHMSIYHKFGFGKGLGTKMVSTFIENVEDFIGSEPNYILGVAMNTPAEYVFQKVEMNHIGFPLYGETNLNSALPAYCKVYHDPLDGSTLKIPAGSYDVSKTILSNMGIKREILIQENPSEVALSIFPNNYVDTTQRQIIPRSFTEGSQELAKSISECFKQVGCN